MKRSDRYRWIAVLSAALLVGGIAISTYAGLQIRETVVEQSRLYLPVIEPRVSELGSVDRVNVLKPGTFIGTMNIPSIKKRANIFEGTDSKTLKKGVGHYLQSVMPGVVDNSVLSGHRDTVFSSLGKVKVGAFIIIGTNTGTHIYRVNRIRIVNQNDRTVIVPTETATLTLSTCYPFRFIGNAPKRYIVQATLVAPEEEALTL
jgi:sortase A